MEEITQSIVIDFQYFKYLNIAMVQNGIPLAKSIIIKNNTDSDFENLFLELKPELSFVTPVTKQIAKLSAGETLDLPISLEPVQQFVLQVADSMDSSIGASLVCDGKIVAQGKYPVTILPSDYLFKSSVFPELTASFVMPNLLQVKTIVSRAAKILQEFTGDSTIDGYESRNINRVRQMAGAIYAALQEQNIAYQLPPADTEAMGQRIRLADEVLNTKTGTCIDMALLFASCLESARLYPIIILTDGHCFVGLHLMPETFADSVSDDITILTKRLANGTKTVEVIEATALNGGNGTNFEDACTSGAANLVDINEFECLVDIMRCRYVGIKPLPRLVTAADGTFTIEESADLISDHHDKPEEISIYDIPSITANNQPVTKQTIWERKLLDLSLRNTLLNMRFGKKNLMLISSNIGKIEDILAGGEEFKVMARPAEFKSENEDFDDVNVTLKPGSQSETFILKEIEAKRLHSLYSDSENEAALKQLYRDSKRSLEENGANTLYLAIGVLRWYETDKAETPRYAPILLLPIEIVRRSSASGYIIRGRDEDVIANITLAEMLRQNFGLNMGLPDPLPTDESGVDVPMILAIVRKAIMSMSRWDVEEKAVIGNFSFNKFVMWNDIHSHADLLANNKMVNSLINGKLTYSQENTAKTAEQMDREYTPAQMLLPVSCDSSQLEAVEAAASGNSFIMFGPPGTGKSQTITNIIANALYRGKRVLFVAQKSAALDVVRTRLDKLGLGPFTLDVFSNKANKSDVLSQLNDCVEVTRYKEPADFASDAQRLMELRNELNGMMDSTHKPLPCGLSLFDAINQYVAMGDAVEGEVAFPFGLAGTASKDMVALWMDIVNEASVIAKTCGNPAENPLRALNFTEFDQNLRANIEKACSQSCDNLSKLEQAINSCNEFLKVSDINTPERLAQFINIVMRISEIKQMNAVAASFSDNDGKADLYFTCLQHGKSAAEKKLKILKIYKPEVFARDWTEDSKTWNEAADKFFISRWLTRRGVEKNLKQYLKSGEVHAESDLKSLMDYQGEMQLANTYAVINDMMADMPGETVDDWTARENFLRGIIEIDDMLRKLANDPMAYNETKRAFSGLFAQGFRSYQDFYAPRFQSAAQVYQATQADADTLYNIAGLAKDALADNGATVPARRANLLSGIAQNLDGLKDWYLYLNVRRKAEANSMTFAMEYLDKTDAEPENWNAIFKKSLYKAVCDHVFAIDENAKLFKGEIFDDKVKRYRELNDKYMELAKAELYAIMASRAPNFSTEASKNSEPGILMKNIRSNGRGTSIRKIFDSIPNLLPRLCPCMLMSPMSVAQYLTLTDKPQFDITIFDEASQMPTSDAVGSIARSENVVITGDPKQMPPTSFFSSSQTDEENIEVEDLESILDDALALNFSSKNLLFHYRSKHESLITFSNHEYYDNSLLTFPSPDNRISKVTFEKVDGYYDKGKTRRNPAEAKAVVDEIERRLSDPELAKRSIGVVTFSIVQQQLIDDMITELFTKKPELETIANNGEEPLFCKNLENVQGDERDVILFSVGYGPDENGKVSMNFGPLNQKGGERRLNVAVSRARYEMNIFSTLTADMIDTNRTSAVGVEGLKKFLAFAQHGTSAIKGNSSNTGNEISKDLAKELKAMGYDCDVQVGCSGFKIDVAVCDPNDKNRYVLAILTDSNDPARIKTARDREICQPSVLKMLGWKVMKVWSIDWLNNKDAVLDKVAEAIENAKNPSSEPEPEKKKIEIQMEEVSPDVQTSGLFTNPNAIQKQVYQPVEIPQYGNGAGDFTNAKNAANIRMQIEQVIEAEAPILADYLMKRVLGAWGISRVSNAVAQAYNQAIGNIDAITTSENGDLVFWKADQIPANYKVFRTDDTRECNEIPPVEYQNAIKYVLQTEMALPFEDLKKAASKHLGFARMGDKVLKNIEAAMLVLVRTNQITERDEKVVLVEQN